MKLNSKVMKNILKIIGIIYLSVEILANLDGALGFLNRIGINITNMDLINIAKSISAVFHFITPFLVIGCIYYIIVLKEKIIALKKFRDADSIDMQKYMFGLTEVIVIQIKKIYKDTLNAEWKKGEEDKLHKIYSDSHTQQIKDALEEYNKAFPECKPFIPYESK